MHKEVIVPLAWQWVSRVREELGDVVASYPEDVRDAVIMAGSELAENVVKYGEPVPGHERGQVSVDILGNQVRLSSSNGIQNSERIAKLRAHIGKIRAAADLQALYIERLRQLIDSPCEDSTGLGLIRIAFEGRFLLSMTYDAGVLTILAERSLE